MKVILSNTCQIKTVEIRWISMHMCWLICGGIGNLWLRQFYPLSCGFSLSSWSQSDLGNAALLSIVHGFALLFRCFFCPEAFTTVLYIAFRTIVVIYRNINSPTIHSIPRSKRDDAKPIAKHALNKPNDPSLPSFRRFKLESLDAETFH